MQITTLIENYVEQKQLHAEHGFSLLIDTGTKKILFDTGQTARFLLNAQELGIDMREIDFVVLSHGHYDHTGGLYPFLQLNKKAIVICKKEVFIPKYNSTNKFIGVNWQDDLLKNRVSFIDTVTELVPDIFIIPRIIIHHPIDTHFDNLLVKVNDHFIKDEMQDELFITIKYENKISILTACSHRGISNICKTATDYFKLPIHLIAGGFHLRNCSQVQYNLIVDYLKTLPTAIIGACHCTGVEKFSSMRQDLKNPIFYNYTGRHIYF